MGGGQLGLQCIAADRIALRHELLILTADMSLPKNAVRINLRLRESKPQIFIVHTDFGFVFHSYGYSRPAKHKFIPDYRHRAIVARSRVSNLLSVELGSSLG